MPSFCAPEVFGKARRRVRLNALISSISASTSCPVIPAKIDDMWRLLYASWVASEIGILIFTRTRSHSGKGRDRGSLLLLWSVITASISLGTWYGEVHPRDVFRNGSQARLLSILFLGVGLAVRWTAILKLGRSFTANVVIQAKQRVEKTGVFRLVRHPSYSGLLIIFAGIGLN